MAPPGCWPTTALNSALALSALATARGSSAAEVALGATLGVAGAVSARADRYFGSDVALSSRNWNAIPTESANCAARGPFW